MTNQNNESVADEIIGVTMDTELSLPQMTKRIVGILEQQLNAANQQIKALREESDHRQSQLEEWDLALSEHSEYEGDEAPWHTMRDEFANRDEQIAKLKAELGALRSAFCQECAKALVTGGRYAVGTCLHCTGVKHEAELEAARAALRGIKLYALTTTIANEQLILAHIVKLCIRAGVKEKLDQLSLLADATKGKEQA
jgi:hypothetical protein